MEEFKEKLPMIIAVIVAIVICVGGFYFLEGYETVYYTQIDNEKIQSVSATLLVNGFKTKISKKLIDCNSFVMKT